jgi:hypothetical protein
MTNNISCSVLYYPGQDVKFGCLVGHADLEFEGSVYTFGIGNQLEVPLDKRIKKTQNGGLPFTRFSFQLTQEQSTRLREILRSKIEPYPSEPDEPIIANKVKNSMIPPSYSCMDCVSNVLAKANIMQIPKIIKLSPLLSSLYLHEVRSSGDKRVTNITYYGNTSTFRNYLIVNCCRLGEIGAIALPILISAYALRKRKAILAIAYCIFRQRKIDALSHGHIQDEGARTPLSL